MSRRNKTVAKQIKRDLDRQRGKGIRHAVEFQTGLVFGLHGYSTPRESLTSLRGSKSVPGHEEVR